MNNQSESALLFISFFNTMTLNQYQALVIKRLHTSFLKQ